LTFKDQNKLPKNSQLPKKYLTCLSEKKKLNRVDYKYLNKKFAKLNKSLTCIKNYFEDEIKILCFWDIPDAQYDQGIY